MSKSQDSHDRHASISVTDRSSSYHLPLSEVLRPRTFDDLLISEEIIRKFKKMIETDQIMNMIFVGRPASGKTSVSKMFEINRETLRINASSDNDLSFIKKTVSSFATCLSLSLEKKIVIFDEADFLTVASQAALRALIEETQENCRYLFIVNNMKKIDPALISRCMPVFFDIKASDLDLMIFKYIRIINERLRERNIKIENQTLIKIVKLKFPDFRAIANELEFASM